MKRQTILGSVVLLFSIGVCGVAAAATPSASMLANPCAGCHGPNGSSMGPATPTIGGLSKDYFVEAMLDYQKGKRAPTIMDRIAKGYSKEEIDLLAEYFAKQPFVRIKQDVEPKLAAFGEKLHKKYCEKCHEDGGRSTKDDTGVLAGQMMPYLQISLDAFVRGSRDMTKKMQKRLEPLYEKYGDKGMETLVHYYGSQQ